MFQYLKSIIQKVISISKANFTKSDQILLVQIIFFFLILTFTSSNKLIFLFSTLFFLVQVYTTRSFYKSIALCFFPFTLLVVGQRYSFLVIPFKNILFGYYPEGRSLYYFFSPIKLLLYTSIAALIISSFLRRVYSKPHDILFGFSLVLIAFSSLSSTFLPVLSFLDSLTRIGFFSLALVIRNYSYSLKNSAKKSFIFSLMLTLIATITLLFLIVSLQFVLRSPIGLALESSHDSPEFGTGADEKVIFFRPLGVASHSNELANYLLFLLFSFFMLAEYLKSLGMKIKEFIYFGPVVLLLVMGIMTQSRALYIALFFFFLGYLLIQPDQRRKIVKFFHTLTSKYKYAMTLISIPLVILLFNRLYLSFYTLSATGGVNIRKELFAEAVDLIKIYPLFGVGTGMYIPATFSQNPYGVITYFPESVHNGILLHLVENGFLSLIFYLASMVLLFYTIRKESESLFKVSLLAYLSILIFSLFHPYNNFFSEYVFTLFIL